MQPDFGAVLFDMDGTLVDTEPTWLAAEIDVMDSYGLAWTEEDQLACLGGPMSRTMTYMSQKLTDAGVEHDPEAVLEEVLLSYEGHLASGAVGIQHGAVTLLQEARSAGLPVALVSNSPRHLMDIILTKHPELSFDTTIAAYEAEPGKPDPAPYLEAARRLEVPITDCLIVEDSPTGVQSARDSGAAVVAYTHLAELDAGPRGMSVSTLEGVTLTSLASELLGRDRL